MNITHALRSEIKTVLEGREFRERRVGCVHRSETRGANGVKAKGGQ